jgi:hypothetical protein
MNQLLDRVYFAIIHGIGEVRVVLLAYQGEDDY